MKALRYISFVLVLLLTACKSGASSNSVTEGTIVYDITYPKPPEDKYYERMYPREMVMNFKDHRFASSLSMANGFIWIKYINDPQRKEIVELLRFMMSKYFYPWTQADMESYNMQYADMTKTKLTTEKMIAGYSCKGIEIDIKGDVPLKFTLYYTEDIAINGYSTSLPYGELPGVPLEYQLERYNIVMKLSAREVSHNQIDEAELEIPKEFQLTSKKEMEELHESFSKYAQ